VTSLVMFSKFSSWLGWGKSSEDKHEEEKKKKSRLSLFRRSRRHPSMEPQHQPEPESEAPLSPAMLNSWLEAGAGLENLLNSSLGVATFRDFLASEFSTENLDFWLACRSLETGSMHFLGDSVAAIFSQFILAGSPQEVSLDSRVRERLVQMREQPSRDMFKEAQAKIFTLMHRDSFPRFLASTKFKELQATVQQEDDEPDGGVEETLSDIEINEEPQLTLKVPGDTAKADTKTGVSISVDSPDSGIGEDGLVRIDTVERQFHSMINQL